MKHLHIFSFVKTVKFKAALWFALLYAVAAAASYLLLFRHLRDDMISRFDDELLRTVTEMQSDYLAGSKLKNYGAAISTDSIPPESMALFGRKLPGFRPLLAFESRAGLNVIGGSGGKLFLVRQDGTDYVYSRQIDIARNIPALKRSFAEAAAAVGSRNVIFWLADDASGKVLLHSGGNPDNGNTADIRTHDEPFVHYIDGIPFRVLPYRVFGGKTIAACGSMLPIYRHLEYLSSQYAFAALLVLVPAVICGWLVAGRFIAGVVRVGDTAGRIASGGDFSQRVAVGREGLEIAELCRAFNRMTANTEQLLQELKQVTDNIAHDLKTPITRIRGMAEVTVRGSMSPEAAGEALGNIAEECDNMVGMINNMLEITRTETSLDAGTFEKADISALVRLAVELFEPLAADKKIKLSVNIPDRELFWKIDKFKIQRMTANLLDNAVKFTPDGGEVVISLAVEDGCAVLRVQDNGPGIPDCCKEKIFRRFYRCDSSRTKPGNGLGLPMVKAIASAHGGRISVLDAPDGGAVFEIYLPAEPGAGGQR